MFKLAAGNQEKNNAIFEVLNGNLLPLLNQSLLIIQKKSGSLYTADPRYRHLNNKVRSRDQIV